MESAVSFPAERFSAGPESGWSKPFRTTLTEQGLSLVRDQTTTLQINVGLLCNQTCRHCHLDAGPHRREVMTAGTVDQVIAYAGRSGFAVADITGGAPELNPCLDRLIAGLVQQVPRIMLRSNLTALSDDGQPSLIEFLKAHGVVVVASFPALQPGQTDAQRGPGVFQQSLGTLKRLNAVGYGREGSGLELNLVSNPSGAFLPPSQTETEKRFRKDLENRWGLFFNHLYVFANVPLGRFRDWLDRSGNLQRYQEKLASGFNPAALAGVMCRSLVSVSWEGILYDCDFNLALDLPYGGEKVHISEMEGPPPPATPIRIGDHCYACTAGSGFS